MTRTGPAARSEWRHKVRPWGTRDPVPLRHPGDSVVVREFGTKSVRRRQPRRTFDRRLLVRRRLPGYGNVPAGEQHACDEFASYCWPPWLAAILEEEKSTETLKKSASSGSPSL